MRSFPDLPAVCSKLPVCGFCGACGLPTGPRQSFDVIDGRGTFPKGSRRSGLRPAFPKTRPGIFAGRRPSAADPRIPKAGPRDHSRQFRSLKAGFFFPGQKGFSYYSYSLGKKKNREAVETFKSGNGVDRSKHRDLPFWQQRVSLSPAVATGKFSSWSVLRDSRGPTLSQPRASNLSHGGRARQPRHSRIAGRHKDISVAEVLLVRKKMRQLHQMGFGSLPKG